MGGVLLLLLALAVSCAHAFITSCGGNGVRVCGAGTPVYTVAGASPLVVSDCVFYNCKSFSSQALCANHTLRIGPPVVVPMNTTLVLSNVTFQSSSNTDATSNGGAITGTGGSIYITGGAFINCTSLKAGGSIYNEGGYLEIKNTVFSNSHAVTLGLSIVTDSPLRQSSQPFRLSRVAPSQT